MSKVKVARKAPVLALDFSWAALAAMFMKAMYQGEAAWNKLTPEQKEQIIAAVKKLFGFSTPRLAPFVPPKKK